MARTNKREEKLKKENTQTSQPSKLELCPECGEEAFLDEDGVATLHPSCYMKRRERNTKRFFDRNKEKLYDLIGVPYEFIDADIKHCSHAIQCLVYDSCFIHGSRGVGKTYAAVALMKAYMLSNQLPTRPKFITTAELLLKIRSGYNQPGFDEAYFITQYTDNTSLLILDDIGAEKPTEWSIATLGLIVDKRYSNDQMTIYTSNLDLNGIAKVLGDRIASRIAGHCVAVNMNGEDRRIKR